MNTEETVFIYHEFQDDQAYGTQKITAFRTQADGREHLRKRVETVYGDTWENIVKAVSERDGFDTFEKDYVSISFGDYCQFFVLEPVKLN